METDVMARQQTLDRPGGARPAGASIVPFGRRLQNLLLLATWTAFSVLFVYGLTTFLYFNLPSKGVAGALASIVPSAAAVAALWLFGPRLASRMPARIMPRIATVRGWLMFCFAVGAAARLIWALAGPFDLSAPSPFLATAQQLVQTGVFETAGEHGLASARAYYPPGVFLFQALFVLLFGNSGWVVFLIGLVLFASYLLVTHALAEHLFDRPTARLACLLITIWPIHLFGVIDSQKEQLTTLVIPLILLLYLRMKSRETGGRVAWGRLAVIGCLFGAATLIQPSLAFLFLVPVANELIWDRLRWRHVARWAVLLGCLVATVAPWSIRNYKVFDAFVPLTTGGWVALYVANNPNSRGAWMRLPDMEALHASGVGEFEGAHIARQRALDWITNNPVAFLRLIPSKIGLFMSTEDDYIFKIFEMRRPAGADTPQHWLYRSAKIVTGIFWPAFMALIILYVVRTRGRWREQGSGVSLLMMAMLYAASMSSVFEGANRHHYAFAVLLTGLAAAALRPDTNIPWSTNRNPDGRQPV